ncbi:MAG TPA: hypothetical protein VHA14_17245 [Bryobacteraceae bacterium]|nr:hypothetical protein [Bryobacteraceae bacterium]
MPDNPIPLPAPEPERRTVHAGKTFFLRIGTRGAEKRIGFRQTIETFDASRGPADVIELPKQTGGRE